MSDLTFTPGPWRTRRTDAPRLWAEFCRLFDRFGIDRVFRHLKPVLLTIHSRLGIEYKGYAS